MPSPLARAKRAAGSRQRQVALTNALIGARLLVSDDPLYRLISENRLPEDLWPLLDQVLPRRSNYKGFIYLSPWSPIRRLSEGVIETFVNFRLDPSRLVDLTEDEDVLKTLVTVACLRNPGRQLVQRALEADKKGKSKRLSQAKRQLLQVLSRLMDEA